jgi:hypothetical protein
MIDFLCTTCGQINLDDDCLACTGQADDMISKGW